jgi:hypothetical protein
MYSTVDDDIIIHTSTLKTSPRAVFTDGNSRMKDPLDFVKDNIFILDFCSSRSNNVDEQICSLIGC